MGSNQNRFGDNKAGGSHEWGSKDKKDAHAQKRASLDKSAIDDSAASNEVKKPEACLGCEDEWCPWCDFTANEPKKKYKKDTKRWCRGKEGREHNYVLIEEKPAHWYKTWQRWECSGCQKKKNKWV